MSQRKCQCEACLPMLESSGDWQVTYMAEEYREGIGCFATYGAAKDAALEDAWNYVHEVDGTTFQRALRFPSHGFGPEVSTYNEAGEFLGMVHWDISR